MAAVFIIAGGGTASAQYHKERGLVRDGNDLFERRNFRSSLNRYNEALEHDSMSYEALYNRANAYHHTRKSMPEDSTYTAETAFRNYEQIAADTLLSKRQRAEVLRNLGQSLFTEERYEAALNAFRESLLLNPSDKETKYDYILTKRIVDQKRNAQQQQQQNNDQNQNQDNQDNQQNQDQNQNQDNQQQQNQDQNQNQDNQQQQNNSESNDNKNNNQPNEQSQNGEQPEDKNEGENDKQPNEGDNNEQPEDGGMPRPEELTSDKERMLDAIQAEEDKTQEKLKEGKKAILIRGKKNW